MFSASATRLHRITDLRARNYRHVVLFLLLPYTSSPFASFCAAIPFPPPLHITEHRPPLFLFLLTARLPLLLLLLRDSNAADIRPGSRPFYVNHVVKDPTPPPDLEEAPTRSYGPPPKDDVVARH